MVAGAGIIGTGLGLGLSAVNRAEDGVNTRSQASVGDALLWGGVAVVVTGAVWLLVELL